MSIQNWRMDLKRDIRTALARAEGVDPEGLEPDDYQDPAGVILAAVLPHMEAAYERGAEGARLRAGSRLVQENLRLRRLAEGKPSDGH
ncbi:hypothetical protein [Streptomyces tsukubensis]|uniref:hypothetical protein n=1 Tax=Streptomyces tsukubensis TaxID=83656 RepID=UPI00344D5C92